MTAFIDRLEEAGLLKPPTPKDPCCEAIAGLCREYQADRVTNLPTGRRDGARRVRLYRNDEDRAVGAAYVLPDGRVLVDVVEVIA